MKTYAITTLFNGNEMVRQLLVRGITIDGVIGLAEGVAGPEISGYESPADICERHDIEFVSLSSYTMTDDADRVLLDRLGIDVALILGWQRLVPDWFLGRCSIGAVGVHGSATGITGGRGRSPQNWAILLGKDEFHLSIFFADAGADSGPVIDSQSFPLSKWDDIRTSHLKVGRVTVDLLARNFENGRIARRETTAQSGAARYLPKRLPEDGEIDWTRPVAAIHAFVRALTDPYPGAFSRVGGGELRVWRVRPFTEAGPITTPPGTIVDRFEHGELLVAAGDGLLFVDEYDEVALTSPLDSGDVLPSADFGMQMASIASRHKSRYPDLPLAEDVLMLAAPDPDERTH